MKATLQLLLRVIVKSAAAIVILFLVLASGFYGWQFLQAETSSTAQLWDRAQAAIEAKEWDTAEPLLRRLIQINPKDGRAHFDLANVYRDRLRKDDFNANHNSDARALEQLRIAGELLPKDIKVQHALIYANFRDKREDLAVEAAKKAVESGSVSVLALDRLVDDAIRNGRFEEAEKYLDKMLSNGKLEPERFSYTNYRVQINKGLGKRRELQRLLDETLDFASRMTLYDLRALPGVHRKGLAEILNVDVEVAGNPRVAHQKFQRAVGLVSDLFDERYERVEYTAKMLATLEKHYPIGADENEELRALRTASIQAFERVAGKHGNLAQLAPIVAEQLAQVAVENGDTASALQYLNTALEQNPDLETEHRGEFNRVYLGVVRHLLSDGGVRALRTEYRRLDSTPNARGFQKLLQGLLRTEEGQVEEAIALLTEAQAELGDAAAIDAVLAFLQLSHEDWTTARTTLAGLLDRWGVMDYEDGEWVRLYLGGMAPVIVAHAATFLEFQAYNEATETLTKHAGLLRDRPIDSVLKTLAEGRNRLPQWNLAQILAEAKLLDELGEIDEAGKVLEQYTVDHPDDYDAQMLVVLRWMSHDQYDKALSNLLRMSRQFPSQPVPQVMLAENLMEAGEKNEAIAVLAELRQHAVTEPAATLLAAIWTLQDHNCPEAVAVLRGSFTDSPRYSQLQFWTGREKKTEFEYHAASTPAKGRIGFIPLSPSSDWQKLQRIADQFGARDTSRLAESVDSLLEEYPDDEVLLLARSRLAEQSGDFDKALEWFGHLEKSHPSVTRTRFNKAELLESMGKQEEALEEVDRVLLRDPENVAGQMMKAKLLLSKGRYSEALATVRQLQVLEPELTSARLLEARILVNTGDVAKAVTMLEAIIDQHPEQESPYLELAEVFATRDDKDNAIAVLRRGLRENPKASNLNLAFIKTLCLSDRWEEAYDHALKFSTMSPTQDNYLKLAENFLEVKWYEAARTWLSSLLDENAPPAGDKAYELLAETYYREAMAHESNESAEQAVEYLTTRFHDRPTDVELGMKLLQLIAFKLHKMERAATVAEEIRSAVPSHQFTVDQADMLCRVLLGASRLVEARELADRVLSFTPNSGLMHLRSAQIHKEEGHMNLAALDVDKAIDLGLDEEQVAEARRLKATLQEVK